MRGLLVQAGVWDAVHEKCGYIQRIDKTAIKPLAVSYYRLFDSQYKSNATDPIHNTTQLCQNHRSKNAHQNQVKGIQDIR
jgi:hypothetical protein